MKGNLKFSNSKMRWREESENDSLSWQIEKIILKPWYINTWRVCQTRVYHSQIFDWKQFTRHSFSLFGGIRLSPQTSKTSEATASLSRLITSRTMDDYRNSPTIKFCADLFPAHRCPAAVKFKIRLECASVNWSNVLLISKAYFPANEMN